jgi:c-di-GMP-binding flagellar brake protein YcgR
MIDPTEGVTHGPLLDPAAFPRYLVREHREIVHIMNALIGRREFVTAHLGASSFITAVLAVSADGRAIIFGASPDEQVNGRATAGGEITCTARLERVRLQFALAAVERFAHDGYQALRAPLPDGVLRLQRREFFRLATPVAAPLMCTITHKDAQGRRKSIPVRVLDISSGGVAVVVPPADLPLAPGMAFDDCRLSLPDSEPLAVRITVRNLFHIDRHNGARVWRAGCEFVDLSNTLMARIQRYIFKLERERNARESGF